MNNLKLNENVELESADNSYAVEMYEALERLYDNKDFQKVILDGYFKNEPIRITSMLATDYIRKTGKRPELMEHLVAISNLEDWFNTIVQIGAPVEYTDEELLEEELGE